MPERAPVDPDGHRIVFAGGCPRSGLTVLRRVLAPHSLVHCGPDTGLPPSIAMQWQNFAGQLGAMHRQDFGIEAEDMRRAMAELLTGLLDTPLAADPAMLLVEKTSLNIAAFTQLAQLLPGARFIHVVRDGRDTAASLLARDWCDANGQPFAHVAHPEAALKYWAELTGLGLQAERALNPRIHRVRYEDLAARPRATLTALTAFLGLKFEPAMLYPAAHPVELKGLERDSLPLIGQPLTRRRIGAGAHLDGQVSAPVRQMLDALGYGAASPPSGGQRRRRVRG